MEEKKTHTRTRHSFQERLKVVELYQQGNGCKKIARMLGLDDSMVRSWLRKYKAYGAEALRPYWRGPKVASFIQSDRRRENEDLFRQAYPAYVSSLEPVASIARRFRIDYHSFKYHVQRYHPELVQLRETLRLISATK